MTKHIKKGLFIMIPIIILSSIFFIYRQRSDAGRTASTHDSQGQTTISSSISQQNAEEVPLVSQEKNYSIRELNISNSANQTIRGHLYLPNASSSATVIISHGFGSTYSYSTYAYAQALADAGITAYVYDFRGGSRQSTSDGDMNDMSVLTEKNDLETVIEGIKSMRNLDTSNLFLMGESQGGFVSALAAVDYEDELQGLILYQPALVIPDYARDWYGNRDGIPDNPSVRGYPVGRTYFEDVIDMNAYAEISAFKKDVLIVHGDADNVVPISSSQRAIEEYASAELLTISGAGHNFRGEDLKQANQAAIDFIHQHKK